MGKLMQNFFSDETKLGLHRILFQGDEKRNYEKIQFEREIIDVVRSSYI
jgi:hypothetical protein